MPCHMNAYQGTCKNVGIDNCNRSILLLVLPVMLADKLPIVLLHMSWMMISYRGKMFLVYIQQRYVKQCC